MQVVNSQIESVTVYSSGAVITRVAKLVPADGAWPPEVRLAGLPLALDDASVKVRVEGAAGAGGLTAVGFRVGLDVLDGAPFTDPPEEEALRAARQEVLALDDRLKDLDRLSRRFTQLSLPTRPAPAEGEAPPPSPHAGRIALLDFQQQRVKSQASAAHDLREKLKAARELLEALEDRKRRASTAREARRNELRKTLVVALNALQGAGAERARLFLEYRVPGARWAPSYALHFDKDLSHVSLSVRAVVAQRTGEDWQGVRLTLSTARMQAWTELPELASLRLGRWQSSPRSGWRPLPAGAEELYADCDRAAAQVAAESATAASRETAAKAAAKQKPPSQTGEVAIAAAAFAPPLAAPAPGGEFTRLFQASAAPSSRPAQQASPPAQLRAQIPRPSAAPTAAPGDFTTMLSAPASAAIPVAPAAALPQPMGRKPSTRSTPALLNYATLRMLGPGEAGHGKLTATELAAHTEIFASFQMKVRVDTVAVVQAAHNDAARLSDLPPGHAFPTTVEGFDYAYSAQRAVDIASDGRFHVLPLMERETGARRYYVAVPREAPDVFRFAEIANPLDAPLLSGPADIYTGNSFLMTVPLRLTPSKGVIKLGLGVEQRIKIARSTSYAEEAVGLTGSRLNLKHELEIEVRNLLSTPAEIEVRERVPVAREGDEQIKVTATAKPPWEPYDPPERPLRGGYAWKIRVEAAGTLRLQAAYTISMPAKMEIATGNRREQ